MLRIALLVSISCLACSSKAKDPDPATKKDPEPAGSSTASGSAPAGSGSATTPAGSGSSAAGSGSDAAGSGSGSGSGSAVAAGSGSGSGAGSGSGGFDFDKLTHDEKLKFMKTKVVPAMKPVFQKFDAKAFAKFGCKTCHGKDPVKSKYKMPSDDIPKLDFVALKAGKQKPKMAEFMGKTVKPMMAKLLEQPEYTEANPKGFGCLECHKQKQ
jgi:hypothetical protein